MALFVRRRDRASSGEGDALLAAAAQASPEAVAKVAGYRAEGATDEDVRSWWNLSRAERIAVQEDDQTARLTLFKLVLDKTGDAELAGPRVFKTFPRYGDPQDTTAASGEDRPLPIVLKDRVNRYIESRMSAGPAFKEELEAWSSFNAHVRRKLGLGQQSADENPDLSRPAATFSRKTLERLRAAAAKCSIDDLVDLFGADAQVVEFRDFDRAVRIAIDQRARHQTGVVGGDDDFRREIGSEIVSGYLVGRRLFGTHQRSLIYSRPERAADNAAALVNGLDTCVPREVYDAAGPAMAFFENWSNYHSDLGHFGDLADRDWAFQQMVVCLWTGLYVAVAEVELFG